MNFNTAKREIIDCLPAYVVMTLSGKAVGAHMTAAAVHSAQWKDDLLDGDQQAAEPLPMTIDGNVHTITLTESMACRPGVWRICLLEDCRVCECCDVELLNECTLQSCEVVVDDEPEDDKCHCP